MKKSCTQCSATFEITQDDLDFYASIDVPPPINCHVCRRQQRWVFRNFFHLYHRMCDLTGKKIISMYDKDASFPVYEMHEWWSDTWDGLHYGQEVDLERSVLSQLKTLHATVPRMSIVNSQCENTDYCNLSMASRNCYLVFGNVGNEDCSYGHIVWQSQNCFDCLYTYRSAFCYECIDCVQCHTLTFSRDCDNCSDSQFLVHCVGCKDSFGCVGLRNKRYCIFNEQHTKEAYAEKIAALNIGNVATVRLARERVNALIGNEIVKHYHGFNCENVTGDYLYNCKNIYEGYDLKNCEDCRYCATLESFVDCHDCNFCPAKSELCYQCLAVDGYKLLSCHNCMNACAELSYCNECYGCKNCFGCVGLKQKRYCIFNKQYTKEEYDLLVSKLIQRMKTDGEWGQFFPHDFSPFCYNETIATEYMPLTSEQALAQGLNWKKEDMKEQNYLGPAVDIPDDIADVGDDISTKILRCEASGRLFKIIPQELSFYRQMKIPLPRKCFEQRQRERFSLRNPRHLWNRTCAKCAKDIETTYSPDRPETVYCENCYLQTVY